MEEFLTTHVYSMIHWPFIAFAFIAMIINQVIKNAFFSKAKVWFGSKVQWFGYRFLPLYPVILGMVVGIFWSNPESGVDTLLEQVAYFAMAGGLSVFLYQFIKAAFKKRGYALSPLPGGEEHEKVGKENVEQN